jgi:hypothetical protein
LTKKRRYEEADNAFYLKYKSLEDMLKIIIYSSQSMLGTVPMLYHIIHNDRQILFIQTAGGVVGGNSVIIHYTIQSDKPNKKFIELKRLSGEFSCVDKIGSESMSLYVPVLELEASNFNFP